RDKMTKKSCSQIVLSTSNFNAPSRAEHFEPHFSPVLRLKGGQSLQKPTRLSTVPTHRWAGTQTLTMQLLSVFTHRCEGTQTLNTFVLDSSKRKPTRMSAVKLCIHFIPAAKILGHFSLKFNAGIKICKRIVTIFQPRGENMQEDCYNISTRGENMQENCPNIPTPV